MNQPFIHSFIFFFFCVCVCVCKFSNLRMCCKMNSNDFLWWFFLLLKMFVIFSLLFLWRFPGIHLIVVGRNVNDSWKRFQHAFISAACTDSVHFALFTFFWSLRVANGNKPLTFTYAGLHTRHVLPAILARRSPIIPAAAGCRDPVGEHRVPPQYVGTWHVLRQWENGLFAYGHNVQRISPHCLRRPNLSQYEVIVAPLIQVLVESCCCVSTPSGCYQRRTP